MFQLWNLIGRSNISNDPIHKFNESDDFFKLLISCYILAAAMELLKMKALDGIPSISTVEKPEELWMQTAEARETFCDPSVETSAAFQFNSPLKLLTDMHDKCLRTWTLSFRCLSITRDLSVFL